MGLVINFDALSAGGEMYTLTRRLYVTADRSRVCGEDDEEVGYLLGVEGSEIPLEYAEALGLVEPSEDAPEPPEEPETDDGEDEEDDEVVVLSDYATNPGWFAGFPGSEEGKSYRQDDALEILAEEGLTVEVEVTEEDEEEDEE